MILGSCPYCDEPIFNSMPDKSPAFLRCVCHHCENVYWLKASRIESVAMTEATFYKNYEVDEKTKSVQEKEAGSDEGY